MGQEEGRERSLVIDLRRGKEWVAGLSIELSGRAMLREATCLLDMLVSLLSLTNGMSLLFWEEAEGRGECTR